MKKLGAFALLTGVAAAAGAQSSVTVFGTVDVAARRVKNGDKSAALLSNNGLSASRIGWRGVEDFGGGLSAGFWLDASLGADGGSVGSSGRFFDRRATVSLMGGFGEARLGRDLLPTYTGAADFDVFTSLGIGTADKFLSNLGAASLDTAKRADNLIAYFLPKSLGGVYGQVSLAAGEGTPGRKYAGGRLGHAAGPLNVSASYGQTEVTPVAGDDTYSVGNFGAAYDFGTLRVSGYYNVMKLGARKLKVAQASASVPLSTGMLRMSYIRAAFGGGPTGFSSNDQADQFALGYQYDFSRRTALYAAAARINNKNNAPFVLDPAPALGLPSPNAGRDSAGFEVGVRHSF